MLGAAPLLVLALPAFVAIEAGGLPDALRGQAIDEVAAVLLEAGHAVTLDGSAGQTVVYLRPPTGGGALAATIDGLGTAAPVTVEMALPPTEPERLRLLAGVGLPEQRGGSLQAVALAVSAYEPALEKELRRALTRAVLEAGFPIAIHRQAVDPRVCIAVPQDEARLSAARPGESCGRVLGRLTAPAKLPRPALVAALEAAAVKLASEAFRAARPEPAPDPEAPPDDDAVLGELLSNRPDDRLPFRLTPGGLGEPLELGWGLIIPRHLFVGGGIGGLARPPALDASGHLELRATFGLGVTAGVLVHGVYAGVPELPVVETSALVGIGYEHLVGFGLALRAGLYGGGRLHLWIPPGGAGGFIVDPVVAVLVGLRYEILPGFHIDLAVPLSGAPPRAHALDDGRYWRREELGIGLHLGLAYRYDLPFFD